MPRIWLDYLSLLSAQHLHTKTRRAFDRALCALPVTQHERVWEQYVTFAKACPVPESAVRIYRYGCANTANLLSEHHGLGALQQGWPCVAVAGERRGYVPGAED